MPDDEMQEDKIHRFDCTDWEDCDCEDVCELCEGTGRQWIRTDVDSEKSRPCECGW